MEMVSKPNKRAMVEDESCGETPSTSRSVVGRGRAPVRLGAHGVLAAAKAKLRGMTDGADMQADRDKTYRLQFPSLTRFASRSRSQVARNTEAKSLDRGALEAKDRSPVRDVAISSDEKEEASATRPLSGKPSRFYKLAVEAAGRATAESLPSRDTLTAEESGAVGSACKAARKVLCEAAKSSNLNGVVRGNINNACREILEAMQYLQNRTELKRSRSKPTTGVGVSSSLS